MFKVLVAVEGVVAAVIVVEIEMAVLAVEGVSLFKITLNH